AAPPPPPWWGSPARRRRPALSRLPGPPLRAPPPLRRWRSRSLGVALHRDHGRRQEDRGQRLRRLHVRRRHDHGEELVLQEPYRVRQTPRQSFATPARAQSSSCCAVPPPTPQAPSTTPLRMIGPAPWLG